MARSRFLEACLFAVISLTAAGCHSEGFSVIYKQPGVRVGSVYFRGHWGSSNPGEKLITRLSKKGDLVFRLTREEFEPENFAVSVDGSFQTRKAAVSEWETASEIDGYSRDGSGGKDLEFLDRKSPRFEYRGRSYQSHEGPWYSASLSTNGTALALTTNVQSASLWGSGGGLGYGTVWNWTYVDLYNIASGDRLVSLNRSSVEGGTVYWIGNRYFVWDLNVSSHRNFWLVILPDLASR
jgi:hypothetical protein